MLNTFVSHLSSRGGAKPLLNQKFSSALDRSFRDIMGVRGLLPCIGVDDLVFLGHHTREVGGAKLYARSGSYFVPILLLGSRHEYAAFVNK